VVRSLVCWADHIAGLVSRHGALLGFWNAIRVRDRLPLPASSITIQRWPKSMPPWAGHPDKGTSPAEAETGSFRSSGARPIVLQHPGAVPERKSSDAQEPRAQLQPLRSTQSVVLASARGEGRMPHLGRVSLDRGQLGLCANNVDGCLYGPPAVLLAVERPRDIGKSHHCSEKYPQALAALRRKPGPNLPGQVLDAQLPVKGSCSPWRCRGSHRTASRVPGIAAALPKHSGRSSPLGEMPILISFRIG